MPYLFLCSTSTVPVPVRLRRIIIRLHPAPTRILTVIKQGVVATGSTHLAASTGPSLGRHSKISTAYRYSHSFWLSRLASAPSTRFSRLEIKYWYTMSQVEVFFPCIRVAARLLSFLLIRKYSIPAVKAQGDRALWCFAAQSPKIPPPPPPLQ